MLVTFNRVLTALWQSYYCSIPYWWQGLSYIGWKTKI